jgi:hypothetical protein
MTSREVIPANRDSSKASAAHRSELETRAVPKPVKKQGGK